MDGLISGEKNTKATREIIKEMLILEIWKEFQQKI